MNNSQMLSIPAYSSANVRLFAACIMEGLISFAVSSSTSVTSFAINSAATSVVLFSKLMYS